MSDNEKQLDIPCEAVTVRDAIQAVEKAASDPARVVTAAQAKVEAVANLTMKAYERASMLVLTPEESKALQADFPDEAFQPGAAGKENLIYIEHAHLRDRLNQVFGLGQWAIVPRNRWAEDFQTYKGTTGSRVYVEAMLLVRGCFVAEAVGDMVYYPKNESTNYGDAVEGAKTAALRRCAKEMGVGLQAWKKDWCIGWWQRRESKGRAPLTYQKKQAAPPTPSPLPEAGGGTVYPSVTVKMVTERTGTKKDGTPWTAHFILLNDGTNDLEVGTFSKTVAKMAQTLSESNQQAEVTVKPGKKEGTLELVSLIPVPEPIEQDNVRMDYPEVTP